MLRGRDTEIYGPVLLLRLTVLLILFCLLVPVGNAQTAQPTPKPSPTPTPRRPLPKLSNGARGFDFRKGSKDASPRLIAVGGAWGDGEGGEIIPKLKSKSAQGYYNLGVEYLGELEYSKAIVPLEKAVKLNPNYLAAYNELGYAYALNAIYCCDSEGQVKDSKFEQMRYRQAIRAFEQARRLAPKNAGVHLSLGLLYFNTGQYKKAVDFFQQGLSLKPKPDRYSNSIIPIKDTYTSVKEVYSYIGQAYDYLGQSENAIKFYQQALVADLAEDMYHERLEVYQYLGNLYQKLGELDKALALYQNYVSGTKAYAYAFKLEAGDALSSIGTIYAAKQQYNEAAAAFSNAVTLYQAEFDRYNQLLANETDAKEFKKEGIARLQPKLSQASYNLGVSHLSLNQIEEAIESFLRVVELDNKNADAQFNIGVAFLAFGDKETAREQAQILKAIDSELAKELEELINR